MWSSGPSALPYGAVMATGGASRLAAPGGLSVLTLPLLWLTVVEAASIPLFNLLQRRQTGRIAERVVPPERRFGDFTIPLGLAVIAVGFSDLTTHYASGATTAITCLAWLSTIYFLGTVVARVIAHWPGIPAVDGAWFLAPAALLGDAIGTARLVAIFPSAPQEPLRWLALIGCGLGFGAYWLVVALAGARLQSSGIAAQHLAPWWISAGCGGLAAAAIGEVARITPISTETAAFNWTALAAWAAGSVLLVPVIAGSTYYLIRLRRLLDTPPWPPTFSTAVYALGASATGSLAELDVLTRIGQVASLATVAIWVATAIIYLAVVVRRFTVRA